MKRQEVAKKIILYVTIFVYLMSLLMTYLTDFFWSLAAKEGVVDLVNIVAIFVDDKIYNDETKYKNTTLKKEIERYAKQYIQTEIPWTKAIVLPINRENIHAYEIYRILENIYFEGISEENSNLIGTILIGDIPLPVINQNGYLFPSIYPYVDFIDQKYIWDDEEKFFIPNWNNAWQAEIWHSLINYQDNIRQYVDFFEKVKKYENNPSNFIGDHIRYEDFIAQKKGFIESLEEYYENKILFTEDIWYIRYSPLMLNIMQGKENETNQNLIEDILATNNDPKLKESKELLNTITEDTAGETAKITDKTIKDWYIKKFSDIFSSQNAVDLRDNIFAWGRYIEKYKNSEWNTDLKTKAHSSSMLIDVKDTIIWWDDSMKGAIIGINDQLEDFFNKKIESEYAMDIVVPTEFTEKYYIKLHWKTKERFNFLYKNYFFGQLASVITDAKDLSIYRGTFRNLTFDQFKKYKKSDLEQWENAVKDSKDKTDLSLKSIGASYDIFSTQTEANRAYNLMNTQTEYNNYSVNRTHQSSEKVCIKERKILWIKFGCKEYEYRPIWECNPKDNDDNNDQNCELFNQFAWRNYWWYSPLNLNNDKISEGIYEISGYQNASRARKSIFDIAWQKKINNKQWDANSYQAERYWSLLAHQYAHLDGTSKKDRKKYANESVILDPTWDKTIDPKTCTWYVDSNGKWITENTEKCEKLDGTYNLQIDSNKLDFFSRAKDYWECKSNGNGFTCTPKNADNLRLRWPKTNKVQKEQQSYNYKTISSVVTNTETSYEHYNGLDTTKYAIWWTLYNYNQDLQDTLNFLIANTNELQDYFDNLNKKIQKFDKNLTTILDDSKTGIKTFVNNINEQWTNFTNIKWKCIAIPSTDGTTKYIFQWNNFDINNLKAFENKEVFDNWEKIYNEIIMFFYNEFNNFQDNVDQLWDINIEDLNQTIKFIISKETESLPLDFKAERIADIKKKVTQIQTWYNNAYNNYSSLFSSLDHLWNTIHSIPKEFSEGMQNLEKIKKEIQDWECSKSWDWVISEINTIIKNFNSTTWIHQNNYLSWFFEYFTTYYEIKWEENEEEKDTNDDNIDCSIILPNPNTNDINLNIIIDDKCEKQTISKEIIEKIDVYSILGNRTYTTKWWEDEEQTYINEGFLKTFETNFKSAPDEKIHITWMTLLTLDKAIDSPRYITFQSIKGNEIKFIYPNLFKVEVYKKDQNKIILKTIPEIEQAIKNYLKEELRVFNAKLEQENTKNLSNNAIKGYEILKKINLKATPYETKNSNTARKYKPIEEKEIIQAIGGEEQIKILAELLYYLNITNQQKESKNLIKDDIQSTRDNFDINQKTRYILKEYLSEWQKKSPLILPSYQTSWYEVAYFNSDGEDFVFWTEPEELITETNNEKYPKDRYKKIKYGTDKQTATNTPLQNNQEEDQTNGNNQEYNDVCDIPMDEGLLLFDIKSWDSPWLKWFQCWWKNLKINIEFDFNEALGPVLEFEDFKEEVSDVFTERKDEIKDRKDETKEIFKFSDLTLEQQKIEASNQNQEWSLHENITQKTEYYNNINLYSTKSVLLTDEGTTITLQSPTKDLGIVNIRLSNTWENKMYFNNQETYQTSQNVFKQPLNITIKSNNKIGKNLIIATMCPSKTTQEENCAKKTLMIETKAGEIENILLSWENTHYENFKTNIQVIAEDKYHNTTNINKDKYIISTDFGTIQYQGIESKEIIVDNFKNLVIQYKSPKEFTDGAKAHIYIKKEREDKILSQKELTLKKLTIKIENNNTDITDKKTITRKINNEEKRTTGNFQISFIDAKGNPINIRNLIKNNEITVTTKKHLIAFVNEKGLTASQKTTINGNKATIDYEESKIAWTDTLSFNIPGYQEYTYTLNLIAGDAYYIDASIEKETIEIGEITTGNLIFTDRWGNTTTKKEIKIETDKKTELINYNKNQNTFTIKGIQGGEGKVTLNFTRGTETIKQTKTININESMIPTENLNILYGNYFGSDWGNQRWYFSNHKNYIEKVMSQSNKMLAVTTQIVNEDNIKQTILKINSDFSFSNFNNNNLQGELNPKKGIIEIWIWDIGNLKIQVDNLWLQTTPNKEMVNTLIQKWWNKIFFIPNSDYTIDNEWIKSEGSLIESWDTLTFTMSNNQQEGYQLWDLNDYGTIFFSLKDITITKENFNLSNEYFVEKTFENGSTDTLNARGIFNKNSNLEIQNNYLSIQDSKTPSNGIGFIGDFKNITLFAQGQRMGEASKAYASELVINFWDPLIQTKTKNHTIDKTEYEGGIWNQIFSDTTKIIKEIKIIDFNNDGLKDLIIIYADGTIKISKNYGTEPYYRNLENLLYLSEDIDAVYVGDIDGNGYEDITIKTIQNNLRGYLNHEGKFDVDGYPICLNTNTDQGKINTNPKDISKVSDLFIEDMNKDGKLDIISNDNKGYVKIFYGGNVDWKPNYISLEKEDCDKDRYNRQKDHTEIVDHNGMTIDTTNKIVDNSMLHMNFFKKPESKSTEEDYDYAAEDLSSLWIDQTSLWTQFDQESWEYDLSQMQNFQENIGDFSTNITQYFDTNQTTEKGIEDTLKYQEIEIEEDNPKIFIPISYLQSKDKAIAYKKYKDINGWYLENGDKVTVTTTIQLTPEGKKEFINGYFGDYIEGPRTFQSKKDIPWAPSDIQIKTGTAIILDSDEFDYLMRIVKIPGNTFEYSYTLTYQGTPAVKIKVEDINGYDFKENFSEDSYPDITMNSIDWCVKKLKVFLNKKKTDIKNWSFNTVFINLQDLINESNSISEEAANKEITDLLAKTNENNEGSMDAIISPTMQEPKNIRNMLRNTGKISIQSTELDQYIEENIMGKLEEIAKGTCEWYTFWGKNNCKGLPVPFNQAFLAPGDYHLFWCIKLPIKPLDGWLPVFHYPGTVYLPSPVWAIPTPFPWWLKSPSDGFLWAWWGSFPSLIRIYVAPTLTAQVGVAICWWPYATSIALRSPIGDLGGNCIVTVIKPQCKNKGDGENGSNTDSAEETFNSYITALKWNECTTSAKGNPGWWYATSPLKTTSIQTKNSQSTFDPRDLEWDFFFGAINLDVFKKDSPAQMDIEHQEELTFANIKAWWAQKNRIKGTFQQGIRTALIDNWLDPQIRYIMNNLTKMNLTIKWPNIERYTQATKEISEGFEKYKKLLKEQKEENQQKKAEKEKKSDTKNESTLTWKLNEIDEVYGIASEKLSNPFDQLSKLLGDNELLSFSTKTVDIKIPMIATEDINAYNVYLLSRIEKNQKIVNQWETMVQELLPLCMEETPTTWMAKYLTEENLTGKNLFNKIKDNTKLWKCGTVELEKFKVIFNFINNFEHLTDQIYHNIQVLQQYRELPFQLYEWIHVLDRYITELTSVINNTLGYFSYWLQINAKRYEEYIDAIILIISTIKSYQILIDFSNNRSEKCSTCSSDSYDQYSCKLSILYSNMKFPILQIPNFRLPNITLDFSDINFNLNVLLPKFNFKPININLPQLPDLPTPPTIDLNFNLLAHLKNLNNIISNNGIAIPELPNPPSLPELPSFIPNVNIDLPTLPPAPKIPALPKSFEATLNVFEKIGEIYCIIKKGRWLVGEKSVKAKIEQISQRTYEVPYFDNILDLTNKLRITAKKNSPVGFDFEISSHLNMQIDNTLLYAFLDGVSKKFNDFVFQNIQEPINQKTKETEERIQNKDTELKQKARDKENELIEKVNGQKDKVSFDEKDLNDTIKEYLASTYAKEQTTQDLEYVDYEEAKQTLLSALNLFEKKSINREKTQKEIKKLKADTNNHITIEPNIQGIKKIQLGIEEIIEEEHKKATLAMDLLSGNSLTPLIAYLQENDQINQWDEKLAFSLPFFLSDQNGIERINKLEDPVDTLLENKISTIDAYLNALEWCETEKGKTNYQTTKKTMEILKEEVQGVYTTIKMNKKPKTLLTYNNGEVTEQKTLIAWTTNTTSTKTNTTEIDPSAFVKGIFVKNTNGDLVKSVYSEKQTNAIWDNYVLLDINGDNKKEIILRDKHNIYIKYANQTRPAKSTNANKDFYEIPIKEFINEEQIKETKKTKVKVSMPIEEIKNFKTLSQNFDTISFTRRQAKEENVVGYLIKFEDRVDTSWEKNHPKSSLHEYLLVLPKGTDYKDLEIQLNDWQKIEKIETKIKKKEILEVRTYNEGDTKVNVGIENIDRMRKYARVTTLIKDSENNYLKIASPRSNQVVAGKQILWDEKGPEPKIQLIREKKEWDNAIVAEWDVLEGLVGTYYSLKITWEDNVQVKEITLETPLQSFKKEINAQSWSFLLNWLFFTGADTLQYYTTAIDSMGNTTEQNISLYITVPEVEIESIDTTEKWWIITATLSNDIDEGNISFQRNRGYREELKTKDKKTTFPVSTNIETISGYYYDLSNNIGLYDQNGNILAEIDPNNWEITIKDEYKKDLEMKVTVSNKDLTIPVIHIWKKGENESLFTITFPTEKIQGVRSNNYIVRNITEKLDTFYEGTAVYTWGITELLINKYGILKANDNLEWEYLFQDGFVTYLLGKVGEEKNIYYTVKVQPFNK